VAKSSRPTPEQILAAFQALPPEEKALHRRAHEVLGRFERVQQRHREVAAALVEIERRDRERAARRQAGQNEALKQAEAELAAARRNQPPPKTIAQVLAEHTPKTRSILADILARLPAPPSASSGSTPEPSLPAESKAAPKRLKKAWLRETMARVKRWPDEPRAAYAQRLFEVSGCPYESAGAIETRFYDK
jgi:hypothetical protein